MRTTELRGQAEELCEYDVLNPCWAGRPHDIIGKHWGGGTACSVCYAKSMAKAAEKEIYICDSCGKPSVCTGRRAGEPICIACERAYTSERRMEYLIESFPCLKGRAAWRGDDSKHFKASMRGMSTSERHCAEFVLMVWNRFENKKFNLGEAAAKLDDENLAPIRAWLAKPWWM